MVAQCSAIVMNVRAATGWRHAGASGALRGAAGEERCLCGRSNRQARDGPWWHPGVGQESALTVDERSVGRTALRLVAVWVYFVCLSFWRSSLPGRGGAALSFSSVGARTPRAAKNPL